VPSRDLLRRSFAREFQGKIIFLIATHNFSRNLSQKISQKNGTRQNQDFRLLLCRNMLDSVGVTEQPCSGNLALAVPTERSDFLKQALCP
jgi:hypothetical protein